VFEHPLDHYRTNLSAYLPYSVVFVICFVLGDLLAWTYHYVKHKVPLFWRFHAVHHSAVDLSPFTDARVHLGEFFVTKTIAAAPFFVLGGNVTESVMLVLLARLWFARLIHANIRTNFGPLRHVMVTPQSHRIHHSVEARDGDRNFGAILTVWDRIFGTQVTDYARYPATGIDDPDFPMASSLSPTELFRTYGRQFVYPFRSKRPHAVGAEATSSAANSAEGRREITAALHAHIVEPEPSRHRP
jgi:sterol desaturase/sphingolipid hydroxylase (fatty acid hydroxylase superfamily)